MNEPVNAEPKTEIEMLREEVAFLKSCGIIEIAVRNSSVSEYMRHWEGRAEKAEGDLAYAINALGQETIRRLAYDRFITDAGLWQTFIETDAYKRAYGKA